eukprot:4958930-Amphidinium_carterae.1
MTSQLLLNTRAHVSRSDSFVLWLVCKAPTSLDRGRELIHAQAANNRTRALSVGTREGTRVALEAASFMEGCHHNKNFAHTKNQSQMEEEDRRTMTSLIIFCWLTWRTAIRIHVNGAS